MEIKKPENFKDILKLQENLDNNINSVRTRTFEDIQMSLIAECVEFNEETMLSHKTWKVKPYNKEKELEELTDIYFFFAQLLNYLDDEKNKELKYVICYSFVDIKKGSFSNSFSNDVLISCVVIFIT